MIARVHLIFVSALVALSSGCLVAGGPAESPYSDDPPCPVVDDRAEPCPVQRLKPVYPGLAVSALAEGYVLIEYRVLANGRTDGVREVARIGNEIFGPAAVYAVQHWVYEPVRVAGEARDSDWRRVSMPFWIPWDAGQAGVPAHLRRDIPVAGDALAIGLRDGDDGAVAAALREIRKVDLLDLEEWSTRFTLEAIVAAREGRFDDVGQKLTDAYVYDGRHLTARMKPTVKRLLAALEDASAANPRSGAIYAPGPDFDGVLAAEIDRLASLAD